VPLYVFAFTDTDLGSWTSRRRVLRTVDVGVGFAICERRERPPELADDALREQHSLVLEIARRARATLPVRFGALLDRRTLVELGRQHEAELRQSLETVRDRAQMTIRVLGRRAPLAAAPAASGREYLESRRHALAPQLPETARELLDRLHPLVVRERLDDGRGGLLATVYHLIGKHDVDAYRGAAQQVTGEGLIVTGPWPPFAFTPRIW
jgi:hypothetical protein